MDETGWRVFQRSMSPTGPRRQTGDHTDMARNYSNIVTAIWKDPDFRALPALPQRTYMMLFSQQDISAAGILAITLSRWARYAADTTVATTTADIGVLVAARFLVVDSETDEVLVRSFIKWDKGYRNPKRRPVLLEAIAQVQSPFLHAAIDVELVRLDAALSDAERAAKPQANTLFDTPSDDLSDSQSQKTGLSNGAYHIPQPTYLKPVAAELRSEEPLVAADATTSPRPDVERVCAHLADRIEANGSKRPTIGATWHTAARLMLDNDKRTVDQIMGCIDWCQADEFWRSNILSMPKLRKQYDRLRLAAHRDGRYAGPRQSTTDQAVAQTLALADELGDEPRRAVAG